MANDPGGGGTRRYLGVVRVLAGRDFASQYKGNATGALSAVLVPLLFLAAYTFVFSTLIPIRLRPDATSGDYAFFLFSGLVGWNVLAETLSRAPRLLSEKSHFVRRALFPVSALPVAASVTSFYRGLVWLGVFIVASAVAGGGVPTTAVLAPLVLLAIAGLAAGLALLTAALGALVRDLVDLVTPVITIWMFLSPLLYPAERVAGVAPWLVQWNPMAPPLIALHGLLLEGALPTAGMAAAAAAWAAGAILAGTLAFRMVRPVMGDVV